MSKSSSGFYQLTRGKGRRGTVELTTGKTSDPQTGARVTTATSVAIRWMFKTSTKTQRIYAANAAQQDIGATTFMVYYRDGLTDLPDAEDHITYQGLRYNIVSAEFVEDEGYILTANQVRSQDA